MRSPQDILTLISEFAQARDDIRAAILTGSRANPAATADRFQDFDVTYVVRDVDRYKHNNVVPQYFGELMILQIPEDMGEPPRRCTSYTYLMHFLDGNRIDLTFLPISDADTVRADSLALVLVDKDQRFDLPKPTLRSYLAQRPTMKQYMDCCNEYWWLNLYVVKGLWRDQLIYSKAILDGTMRHQLMDMLSWYVAVRTNNSVSIGYLGKELKAYLPADLWQRLEQTYSDSTLGNNWDSLREMNELFRIVAKSVGEAIGVDYLDREDQLVCQYVDEVRKQALADGRGVDC
jgi:aminoglycoside 6-adenylyltransferase